MLDLTANLLSLQRQVLAAQVQSGRAADKIGILAVSKSQTIDNIEKLSAAGQQDFGENYLQEALPKISALAHKQLTWHFIGPIQTNKAALIAQNFSWVHTVARLKEAQKLSLARSAAVPPLNICLQVRVKADTKNSGVSLDKVPALIKALQKLPRIRIRGLMTLPPQSESFMQQQVYFKEVKSLYLQLNAEGAALDTLSMGMSHDFVAAISQGSTLIRIGQALFGPRSLTSEQV